MSDRAAIAVAVAAVLGALLGWGAPAIVAVAAVLAALVWHRPVLLAADVTDDFRGAGLSHLLAVSGQNVAFVLALAGPMLRRLGLRVRLPATIAVIAFFALVTRFEPSVLRASAMAALAVTASTMGRD